MSATDNATTLSSHLHSSMPFVDAPARTKMERAEPRFIHEQIESNSEIKAIRSTRSLNSGSDCSTGTRETRGSSGTDQTIEPSHCLILWTGRFQITVPRQDRVWRSDTDQELPQVEAAFFTGEWGSLGMGDLLGACRKVHSQDAISGCRQPAQASWGKRRIRFKG